MTQNQASKILLLSAGLADASHFMATAEYRGTSADIKTSIKEYLAAEKMLKDYLAALCGH